MNGKIRGGLVKRSPKLVILISFWQKTFIDLRSRKLRKNADSAFASLIKSFVTELLGMSGLERNILYLKAVGNIMIWTTSDEARLRTPQGQDATAGKKTADAGAQQVELLVLTNLGTIPLRLHGLGSGQLLIGLPRVVKATVRSSLAHGFWHGRA